MGVEILNNFAEGCYNGAACDIMQVDDCSENNYFVKNSGYDGVKCTLKSKVMERLKNRGLDNITVDFTPKPSYPMTKEEIEKERRRKQSNRESAQRSRDKQKKEDKRNRQLLERLKEEQRQLVNKINESEGEKNQILFNLKQILPDCYIQEALGKIKHTTNEIGDQRSRMESHQINEQETAERRQPMEMFVSNEGLVQNDYIFTENCLDDGEYFLSTLHNVSEDGTVEFLEVGNEETVQFLHGSFVSVENGDVQSNVLEQQVVADQNLSTDDGTALIQEEHEDQLI